MVRAVKDREPNLPTSYKGLGRVIINGIKTIPNRIVLLDLIQVVKDRQPVRNTSFKGLGRVITRGVEVMTTGFISMRSKGYTFDKKKQMFTNQASYNIACNLPMDTMYTVERKTSDTTVASYMMTLGDAINVFKSTDPPLELFDNTGMIKLYPKINRYKDLLSRQLTKLITTKDIAEMIVDYALDQHIIKTPIPYRRETKQDLYQINCYTKSEEYIRPRSHYTLIDILTNLHKWDAKGKLAIQKSMKRKTIAYTDASGKHHPDRWDHSSYISFDELFEYTYMLRMDNNYGPIIPGKTVLSYKEMVLWLYRLP